MAGAFALWATTPASRVVGGPRGGGSIRAWSRRVPRFGCVFRPLRSIAAAPHERNRFLSTGTRAGVSSEGSQRRVAGEAVGGGGSDGEAGRRGFESASTSSKCLPGDGGVAASAGANSGSASGLAAASARRARTATRAMNNHTSLSVATSSERDGSVEGSAAEAATADSVARKSTKTATPTRTAMAAATATTHHPLPRASRSGRGKSYAVERRGTGGPNTTPSSSSGSSSTSGPATGAAPANPKAGSGTSRRVKYNRPPLGDGGAALDNGGGRIGSAKRSEGGGGRGGEHTWLSHQHGSKGPAQQPQQRKTNASVVKMNSAKGGAGAGVGTGARAGRVGAGMRPGERIVKAMEALPRASVHDMQAADSASGSGDHLRSHGDTAHARDACDTPPAATAADRENYRAHAPSAPLEDQATDAQAQASGYRSVDEAVTMPDGRRVKFSVPTLNFAIKELGERGNFERAHALYLWMGMQKASPKYAPNKYTLVSLFGAASERTHARVIIKVWRAALLFTPDMVGSEVGSAAITALGRCENWPAALQIWKDMGDMGEPRNLYAYTAVLTVLRESARWEEAGDVFRAMRYEEGARPDALCAGLMLAAYDGARRWREANDLAKRLGDVYDVRLDEHLAHTVITLAGRAGDMAHARAAFDGMRNSTLVVTTYSYNCLLGGYARNGDWEGAASVLTDLQRAHLRPDSYTYTHLVSAAERSGFYEEADGVWEAMLASRVPPHTVMCGAYVHCLGCQGRWMEAEALIGQMRERWGVRRNAAVYNALLGALVRADKLERALEVLDEMQAVDSILPTEITFLLLVRACQENGMVNRAKELMSVRDSLAETGALENDFSKYAVSPEKVSSSGSEATAAGARAGDVGRMAAGLPPDERWRGERIGSRNDGGGVWPWN